MGWWNSFTSFFTRTIPHVFTQTIPKALEGAAVTVGNELSKVGPQHCAASATPWLPPQAAEGVAASQCPNDPMNAPARDWSYQCGCQGGADLVCPPGTSEYERATGHEWCNAHGVNTCDNAMCLRKGLACYRKAGDFWTGDSCTDKATQIACCDPTGNGAEAHLCPPGYCKDSDLCKRELFYLCNTDAGFAAFPDICKTFAFNNRTRPEFNISTVARKWCADPANAALTTTGYPDEPGGFCSCYNAFSRVPNSTSSPTVEAGIDTLTGHPMCFNGGCAQYGYDDPAIINSRCPDICMQVTTLVAGGNITMKNNHFEQKCPGKPTVALLTAQAHATAAQLNAAEHQYCQLSHSPNCDSVDFKPKTAGAGAGTPAPEPAVVPEPAGAPKKKTLHPIIVVIIVIAVIGIAMGIASLGAAGATAAGATAAGATAAGAPAAGATAAGRKRV